MSHRPNILFLMADQMQAQVLDPYHVCRTPNLDKLTFARHPFYSGLHAQQHLLA